MGTHEGHYSGTQHKDAPQKGSDNDSRAGNSDVQKRNLNTDSYDGSRPAKLPKDAK